MLIKHRDNFTGPFLQIVDAAGRAARAVPPVFPLAATVAVNPFLGQTGEGLAQAAARLARVGGVPVTMPRAHYRAKVASGEIAPADLDAALAGQDGLDRAALEAALAEDPAPARALPTVADLVARATGRDWPGIVLDRIGAWAAAHFDQGQALWPAVPGRGAYDAWRAQATQDLGPEIAGLTGFAAHVAAAPDDAWAAIARASERLGLAADAAETYFHALLHGLGGWAQVARWTLWEAELQGRDDATLTDLLAIRLVWEEALMDRFGAPVAADWAGVLAAHAAPLAPSRDQRIDAVLQAAADHAAQRALAAALARPLAPAPAPDRPALQAVFCIDVRSEVIRRALESCAPGIATAGFAGFFGLPLAHRDFGATGPAPHLPVLLNAAMASAPAADPAAEGRSRIAQRATRAWGRFRQAAVSSFAFVEAAGPLYAGKLVRDALGTGHGDAPRVPAPRIEGLTPEARIATAETVLRAMSMTATFARVVLLAGHGASVTNNPQASALHCGACGGRTGEVSARALAGLLNDPAVRLGLGARGIAVPADTLFVAGLHDTTTDDVALFDRDTPSPAHLDDLAQLRRWLAQAGRVARAERAPRLPRATADGIARRALDWAEVRPEWGLAGCSAFVAAPRARTAGRDLGGRVFLHDYDWRADRDFPVLELILTAPVVVASWISLQYYGSVVAPDAFGAGNKLLHNVVGGFGVLEGNGGAPRAGLAWQSVHDGQALRHDPLRLTVAIEAPAEAMTDVLSRHPGVRALFDNGWLALFAMDDRGRLAQRYAGHLLWRTQAEPTPAAA